MRDKVLQLIQGGGEPNKLKSAIQKLNEEADDLIELNALFAKIQRAKFDALMNEGFSEAQALELSKNC